MPSLDAENDRAVAPIRVAYLTPELGLGGTAKGMVSVATRLDRRRFDVRVISYGLDGPRRAEIERTGVPVTLVTPGELADELAGVDIVHVYRHGIAEPLVPAACAHAGVPVLIESNIFGAHDRSADERRFKCHLFLSMMCLMRYRAKHGGAPDFDERHRVLYLPVEGAALRAASPGRDEACRQLGLDPARPVVGRLGRAADLKWRDLLVDMVPHLLDRVPEAQVVFVGATDAKRERLKRLGIADRVRLIEPVADARALATLYAACDVVVNASMIGESQGLVIAEAMALGLPVVTCSTPWADNAQIEFVQNGETGWVANHPREFAEAVTDLLTNPERRAAFGAAGRGLVDRVLDPDVLTRQLEQLYLHHLSGGTVHWRPTTEEVAEFTHGYAHRARAAFRALSAREQIEARAAREQETLIRRLASARMIAQPLLGRFRRAR